MSLTNQPDHIAPATASRRFRIAACALGVIAVLGLYCGPTLWGTGGVSIGGATYWWLCDDAMISMRYARNITDGLGPVWNAGERVEGFTNPLWTAAMTLPHLLGMGDAHAPLAMLCLTLLFACLGVVAVAQLVDALGGGRLALAGSLILYVLSDDLLAWTTTGAETIPLMAATVYALSRVIRESRTGAPRVGTYLLIGLIPLIRGDGIVPAALICGVALALSPSRRRVLALGVLAVIPAIGYEIFRMAYYGQPLPNTAYLKAFNQDERYAFGARYVWLFIRHQFVPFMAVMACLWSVPERRRELFALAALLVLYTLYVLLIGGDAFRNARFFVPVIPALLALALVCIERLRFGPGIRMALGALCLISTAIIFAKDLPQNYSSLTAHSPEDEGNVRIGLWLKDNTVPGAVVADTWSGSVPYFSHRTGVDLLGKCDLHIARIRSVPEAAGSSPGHNKFDYDYSLGALKPDYAVAPFRLPVDEQRMRREATGGLAFIGQFYFNAEFRGHYFLQPVSNDFWRTIFRRDTFLLR